MSPTESQTRQPVPPARLAEASVWIARLHGDARGRELEDGLRRWLQEDPDNARAFELATEVWEEAANLRRFIALPRSERRPARMWFRPLLAAASCAIVLVIAGFLWLQYRGVITTDVGEQRQVVLDDGTRVFLNTDTRIEVNFEQQVRRVELRRGEAFFNVAKRKEWPFVVVVGDREVRALGTSFVVRKDAGRTAVTLVEGSVLVTPLPTAVNTVAPKIIEAPGAAAQLPSELASVPSEHGGTRVEGVKLAPGQRLTFSNDAPVELDTPSVERTTAWRRGQVILDDTPLQAAAAEMNRYNQTKLVVQDPEAGALLINGLFQAGDSTHFANAVAQAYGLTVIQRGNDIVISGKPVQ
ncbi:MAG TPA: FecR domain-containing protein [Steroidobacter sp.]|uniref:FecR family protein n=1 Tax=Steroidobacter sp. TaxID=1978227 RepID=UPI002ED848E7